MSPLLSIIIAHRNEPEHLLETVRTIRQTSPVNAVEIIVVDDASVSGCDAGKVNPELLQTAVGHKPGERQHKVRIFAQATRKGHAAARELGAKHAAGDWIMFTDAHMDFEPGWFEAFAGHAGRVDRKSLLCGPYLSYKAVENVVAGFSLRAQPEGCGYNGTPAKACGYHHEGTFYGARFNFYGESLFEPGKLELLMVVPFHDRPAPVDGAEHEPFEVPAVIGANYFLTREWFHHIGGLPCFVHWSGTDEWMLSVKTWLCGGAVKLLPDVRVKHILHTNGIGAAGYGKEMDKGQLLFNKLSAAYQLLPPDIYEMFVASLPLPHWSDEMQGALSMMIERKEALDYWRRYCQSSFVRDTDWLCSKFDLEHPADMGSVVG